MAADPVMRPTHPWLRPLFLVLGLLSLGIAVVGIFLPLIPTTGPVLLAAYFFARSSERLHRWLLDHPRFGKFVTDFQAGRGIPRRAKIVALVAMSAALAYAGIFVVTAVVGRVIVGAVWAWAAWYILRVPTASD